jgi:hypothetical protein
MINVPTDVLTIEFPNFKKVCKYFAYGYDSYEGCAETCRKKSNIPSGSSWGECSYKNCPIVKGDIDEVK